MPTAQEYFFVAILVFNYVLSYLFREYAHKISLRAREVVTTTIGISFVWILFGRGEVIFLLAEAFLAWVYLLRYRNRPRLLMVLMLVANSAVHIFFMLNRDEFVRLDITAAEMVMVIKVTTLGYNLSKPKHPIDEYADEYRRYLLRNQVQEVPDLLEFVSFIFHYETILVGPAMPFNQYMEHLRQSERRRMVVSSHRGEITRRSIQKMALALAMILANVVLDTVLDPYAPTRPDWPGVFRGAVILRVLYSYVLAMHQRLMYYFVFTITEGACLMSGLALEERDGKDGGVSYEGARQVDIIRMELAMGPRGFSEYWNMKASSWLKNHVYYNIAPPLKDVRDEEEARKRRALAAYVTSFVSALWHGFYPGYFVTFFSYSLATVTARIIRRSVRPLFVERGQATKKLYDAITFVVYQIIYYPYTALPFYYKDLKPSLRLWKSAYYVPVIIAPAAHILLLTPFARRVLSGRQGVKGKKEKTD